MDIKRILLSGKKGEGKFAIVDMDDFEKLNKYSWCLDQGYAVRSKYIGMKNGRGSNKRIWMHREIISIPKGKFTDHINGDRLDNRKVNLRIATRRENAMNKKVPISNTSGYKGVTWNKQGKGSWGVWIQLDGKHKFLGNFSSKEQAAIIYDKHAKELFGKFARLNFEGRFI